MYENNNGNNNLGNVPNMNPNPQMNMQQPINQDNMQTMNQNNVEPQPINQVQEPIETLSGVSIPNNDKKTKNNKKLIIILVVVLLIVLVVGGIFLSKSLGDKDGKDNGENINKDNIPVEEDSNSNAIKQLIVNSQYIYAVDNNNDLYYGVAYGTDGYYKYYGFEEIPTYPVKIASNVNKLLSGLIYLDNNGDVYATYLRIDGGAYKNFEKVYSNLKDVYPGVNGFCYLTIDHDNQLYVENGFVTGGYCGLNKSYKDPTVIASDVIDVYTTHYNSFYLNTSGELYKLANDESVKILDNVKMITDSGYFIANDGSVYTTNNGELIEKTELNGLLVDDSNKYVDADGNIYVKSGICYNASASGAFTCAKGDSFAKTELTDVERVIVAMDVYNNYKMAYINTSGKLVLLKAKGYGETSIEKRYELDFTMDNFEKIIDFYNRDK